MFNGIRFNWQRYWVARESVILVGIDGFPMAPENSIRAETGLKRYSQIAQIPCLALLGEPGTGKTHALTEIKEIYGPEMRKNGDEQLFLDLRSFASEERLYGAIFRSEEFSRWVNGTHSLEIVLDSLDECLIYNGTVATMLVDEFRKYPLSRLRLRIACRTGEWPATLSDELPELWSPANYADYELAPLLRRDVDMALESHQIAPAIFHSAVHRSMAVALATRPLTLQFLISTWNGHGFPASPVELYTRGCLELCREHNSNRQDARKRALDADQALAIAQRVAALMVLGKRASISGDAQPGADEISYVDVIGGSEPCGEGHTVPATINSVREAVESTGLFSGRAGGRMGWSHWSFAEFLAARYLDNGRFEKAQILALIMHPEASIDPTRRVVPQLRETVGWLCALCTDFVADVIQTDPEILLRSTELNLDDGLRAELVRSLLEQVKKRWRRPLEMFARRDFSNLRYAGLATQLRPYIVDSGEDIRVRSLAAEIAEHCKLQELLPELAKVALDPKEASNMRSAVAHRIARLNDKAFILKLRPLLGLSDTEDPEDDLKGVALKALWPKFLTAAELFRHLSAPLKSSYYGAYAAFLQALPPTLNGEHLVPALRWAANQPQDHLLPHAFGELIARIIDLALDNLDADGVLPALAQLFAARLQRYDRLVPPSLGAKEEPRFRYDAPLRHRITEAILGLLPMADQTQLSATVSVREFCTPEDVPWLVGRAADAESTETQYRWLGCILAAFDWSTPAQLDAILGGMARSEFLSTALRPLTAAVELGSKEGRKKKADYLRQRRLINRSTQQLPVLREPLETTLRRYLVDAESGSYDAWWRMNLDMTLRPPSGQYPTQDELQPDLTQLPGWKVLNEDDHKRCLRVAEAYLRNVDPNTAAWLGKNVLHRPAAAGYRAILLLESQASEELALLPAEVWAKWAPIIMAFPESPGILNRETVASIPKLAYKAAPVEVIAALIAIMRQENQEHGHIFAIRRMDSCWDAQLSQAVLEFVSDTSLKAGGLGDLLDELLQHRPEDAPSVAEVLKTSLLDEPNNRQRVARIAAILLACVPKVAWPLAWAAMQGDIEMGKEIIENLAANHDDNCAARIARGMDEADVALFYVYISRQFPHAEDPHFEGTHWVGPRESVGTFRDSILRHLQERGTVEACVAIDKIITDLPDVQWLKNVRPVAVEATLKETWHGRSPREILALAQANERRVVDNGEQLFDAIVESLERLEIKLHGTTPAVVDLWDERSKMPKNEGRLSDYVKRHLADDLKGRGIVVNREVEIRNLPAGPGEETDILVQACNVNGQQTPVSVIIEVKGCWNPELQTAMEDQLRDRYLKHNECQHGLYLVGWFLCPFWSDDDYRKRKTKEWSLQDARTFFDQQASSLTQQRAVLRAFVLDARVD